MKRLERLQKLCCKIQKCKKLGFFDYFGVHVAFHFSTKLRELYLRKQPYWTTKSFVVEGIQRSDP